jgi:hypothetical protein
MTEYTINSETSTTVSANDQFHMYKTSTGRTMKASGNAIRTYVLGTTTTETLGFFGVTATAQPTSTLQAVVTNSAAVSVSATQWAYTTSTQADGIVRLVNRLRADLVSLGLIAGA